LNGTLNYDSTGKEGFEEKLPKRVNKIWTLKFPNARMVGPTQKVRERLEKGPEPLGRIRSCGPTLIPACFLQSGRPYHLLTLKIGNNGNSTNPWGNSVR